MSLVLVNSAYRLHLSALHTAQEFACEEAGFTGSNYYCQEASNIRRVIHESMQQSSKCSCYTVDNCVAKQLFHLKPDLFFFPDYGLSETNKDELVRWLKCLRNELPYTSGNLATQFISFQPGFQQTVLDLIEYLESESFVYAM